MTAILWFRDDLRFADHPALDAAMAEGPVLPVFVRDRAFCVGGAARWWLHHALADLGAAIAAEGGRLALYDGEAGVALAAAARAVGADTVHAHAARIPAERALQDDAARRLAASGVRLVLHRGALVITSYSIHYTKLYEVRRGCAAAPRPARAANGGRCRRRAAGASRGP